MAFIRITRAGALGLALFVVSLIQASPAHAVAAHRDYNYALPGAARALTVASFGDSIVAGYCGFNCTQPSYAQYYTYLGTGNLALTEGVSVLGRIRATSGFLASQVLQDMENSEADLESADIVTLEACGNDYLGARRDYKNPQSASYCKPARLQKGMNDCKQGMTALIDHIGAHAKPGALVRIMNIYYPGFDQDQGAQCGPGQSDQFLDILVEGNWHTCDYAWRKGMKCIDAFADFNAADGDRAKLAWRAGESLESYRVRVTMTHRHLIRDPSHRPMPGGVSVNLLIDDNTHPNPAGHSRLGLLHHQAGYTQ